MIDFENELKEKCHLIKNDISMKNEITARVAADFAITYYKIFKKDYDEKKFIYLIKKTMEFFNKSILDIPKREIEVDSKKILNEIEDLKDSIQKISKIYYPNNNVESFTEEEFSKEDLKLYEKEFKYIKKELKNLELNRPNILLKWNWKRKIKRELYKLNLLERKSYIFYEYFYEKNKEKTRILEELYNNMRKNIKEFMIDVKPTIGEELADISFEDIIQDIESLKSFTYNVIISNYYQYYTLKFTK